MNKRLLKEIVSYLPLISILAIVALMPFYYSEWQRASFYSLAVTYPLDYIVNRRWQVWQWDQRKALFAVFSFFALLTPLWQLFDPLRTGLYQEMVNVFAPFFFVGIAGFLGMTDKIRMRYAAWVMLGVSAAIVVYLIFRTGFDVADGSQWVQLFNENRIKAVNSHMVVNLYMNMALILGAMVCMDTNRQRLLKVLTALMMLPSLFALLITEGRTGMLTLFAWDIVLLIYIAANSQRRWVAAMIVLFAVGAGVFLMHNDRIREMKSGTNPRIYQWQECWEMIKDRPIAGYGVCSARKEYVRRALANEELVALYIQPEVEQNPDFRRNGEIQYEMMHPHNAVLESWARFGILGLLLALICLIGPMCMRLGRYQIYLTLCALAFLIQAMFESFGNNLQPLFLAAVTLLFYSSHSAEIPPTTPTHA